MATLDTTTQVPDHVPPGLVIDYDVHRPGAPGSDFHVELFHLKQSAPDVFWSPRYEGHWYVTNAALARDMLSDTENFSNRHTTLPVVRSSVANFIPINLDPPDHEKYRRQLSLGLSRKVVMELEPQIRALAIELVEDLQPRGGCEFIAEFAAKLPVISFLRLFDLPLTDREWLIDKRTELSRPDSDKAAVMGALVGYIAPYVIARRQNPGSDFISWLSQREVAGAQIEQGELLNMCTLLLIGGLDTVANSLGFMAKFLAESPEHRRQIIADPGLVNGAVEEMLRRYPTNTVGLGRLCARDTMLGDVQIKAGDMLMTGSAMLNYDPELYPDPLAVDFSRRITRVGTFGEGPHRCPGAGLARLESAIFVEEWLKRIPDFELTPSWGQFVPGANICYDRVGLRW